MGEMSTPQLIAAGGPVMIPMLLCSLVAVTIIFERLFYFTQISKDTQQLKTEVLNLIKVHKIKEAVQVCDDHRSPLAKILKGGILKYGSSREEIRETMEGLSSFEIPKLEKHLNALATIAHITPLLGLLGTALGMAGIFHTIQARATTMNPVTPADLGVGMWQALITTVAGLLIAIPALLAHNFLVSRVEYFTVEMERAATELLTLLSQATEGDKNPSFVE